MTNTDGTLTNLTKQAERLELLALMICGGVTDMSDKAWDGLAGILDDAVNAMRDAEWLLWEMMGND